MMNYDTVRQIILIFILSPVVINLAGAAEDDALLRAIDNPDAAERCVSLHQIDHTRILDNSNLLFYVHGKKIFLNHMPHKCPGLKAAGTYMYRTSLDRLCNVDIIRVLQSVGGAYLPGAGCGLGLFYPIDKETAKALVRQSRQVGPD